MSQRKVAIIGAGISGIVTAAHLKNAGFSVTVFERAKVSGGVCRVYDERLPLEPTYPSIEASKGEEYTYSAAQETPDLELLHAPTSPCYEGLTNNVTTPLLRTTLNAWPEGTEDFVNNQVIKEYIQDTSRHTGVEDLTIYGASVTTLEKKDLEWNLTYRLLKKGDTKGEYRFEDKTLTFDFVSIASGHYHAPRVPDIPGLSEWKKQWPNRISHSKAYRKPDGFKGKNVLLIGAGTSSTDIAREIGAHANKVYQSARDGLFDLPTSLLPPNASRIGEIDSFSTANLKTDDGKNKPIPSTIKLKSGQSLCNIDAVVVCTGYHITLPFLPNLHSDTTDPSVASDTILVTDGTMIHNLHKDIFYIPDPTLAFVGVPYFTATFTLFEFQAMAVAAAFSGRAKLPTQEEMRREYVARVESKGLGKKFHNLRGKDAEYVDELLVWVNQGEGERIGGHTEIWHKAKAAQEERFKFLFEASKLIESTPIILPAC